MSWSNRFKNLFRRKKLDDEIAEELEFHLEGRFLDNIRAGMTPAEARRDAERLYGRRCWFAGAWHRCQYRHLQPD